MIYVNPIYFNGEMLIKKFPQKYRIYLISKYPRTLTKPRTAAGMDGTLPHRIFEYLKPVEISKNCFNII